MRFKGTLTDWKDDRGFGFIEPAEGGSRVFCHIKAFDVRVRRPIAGDRVTYEIGKDAQGRSTAIKVRPVGLEEAQYQPNTRSKPSTNYGRNEPRVRRPWWHKLFLPLAVAAAVYVYQFVLQPHQFPVENTGDESSLEASQSDAIARAFQQRQSGIQVQASGVVDRVLSNDNEGLRHQRFIVRLASGQTVLIAHNIDVAPRVASLATGDRVEFYGEYEWNEKGGVVHWTHHDPNGHHQAGWIKHAGNVYQ